MVIDERIATLMHDAEDILTQQAIDILAYAQENAPWSDRTGDARSGLDVDVDSDGDSITLQLFHTVDYGLWLEVIQNGRFAIIMPTLEHFSSQVLGSVNARETGETS